jgi:hypothetical protein
LIVLAPGSDFKLYNNVALVVLFILFSDGGGRRIRAGGKIERSTWRRIFIYSLLALQRADYTCVKIVFLTHAF